MHPLSAAAPSKPVFVYLGILLSLAGLFPMPILDAIISEDAALTISAIVQSGGHDGRREFFTITGEVIGVKVISDRVDLTIQANRGKYHARCDLVIYEASKCQPNDLAEIVGEMFTQHEELIVLKDGKPVLYQFDNPIFEGYQMTAKTTLSASSALDRIFQMIEWAKKLLRTRPGAAGAADQVDTEF